MVINASFVFASSFTVHCFGVLAFAKRGIHSVSLWWRIPHSGDCLIVRKVKARSNFRRNPLKPQSVRVRKNEIVCARRRCTLAGVLFRVHEVSLSSFSLYLQVKSVLKCRLLWLVFVLGSSHVAVSAGLCSLPPEPGNLWAEPCTETKTEVLIAQPQIGVVLRMCAWVLCCLKALICSPDSLAMTSCGCGEHFDHV